MPKISCESCAVGQLLGCYHKTQCTKCADKACMADFTKRYRGPSSHKLDKRLGMLLQDPEDLPLSQAEINRMNQLYRQVTIAKSYTTPPPYQCTANECISWEMGYKQPVGSYDLKMHAVYPMAIKRGILTFIMSMHRLNRNAASATKSPVFPQSLIKAVLPYVAYRTDLFEMDYYSPTSPC